MKRTQKTEDRDLMPVASLKPKEEIASIRLCIEELESRLAPQSTATILD